MQIAAIWMRIICNFYCCIFIKTAGLNLQTCMHTLINIRFFSTLSVEVFEIIVSNWRKFSLKKPNKISNWLIMTRIKSGLGRNKIILDQRWTKYGRIIVNGREIKSYQNDSQHWDTGKEAWQRKQCTPWSDCPFKSSLIRVCTVRHFASCNRMTNRCTVKIIS